MSKNANQSKQYRIYLKSTKEWVEVPEEFYREQTRYYDTFRHRMQEHGQCSCPKSKFWLCDGDCLCFNFFMINTARVFDLQETTASPFFTASTVIKRSSLTLIPVPHIVCKIRFRRSLFFCCASRQRRKYSAFVNSFSSGQKVCC